MPLNPVGFAPSVPGVSQTNGTAPDSLSGMALMSMMMGLKPEQEDSSGKLIEQVIQLLRKAGQQDPRMAPLTIDALRLLTEGPPGGSAPMGGSTVGMGSAPVPSGGPTSAVP